MLKKEHHLTNDLYTRPLFQARRTFIQSDFYETLYQEIFDLTHSLKPELILDIGCGEGSHLNKLASFFPEAGVIGVDLAQAGIAMATDYLSPTFLPLLADAYHIPMKDKSCDIIFNILSPFIHTEIKRLLKPTGLFIKVAPATQYLQELRDALDIGDYLNEQDVYQNLCAHFKNIQTYQIHQVYPLSEQDFPNLIGMTPMMKNYAKHKQNPLPHITIALNIYVIKGNTL